MVQRGRGTRLLVEALKPLGIATDRGRQYLDRHIASKLRVSGAIDFAHPAGPEGGEDLIRAETGADLKGHSVRLIV